MKQDTTHLKRSAFIMVALAFFVIPFFSFHVAHAQTTTTKYLNGKIAYAHYETPTSNGDIYTINPDGTDVTRLTNTPDVDEYGPTWSPDGKKLLYNAGSAATGWNYYLHVMNADGLGDIQLTAGDSWDYQWSPDGTRIAFYSDLGSGYDIYNIKADGSDLIHIPNSQYAPSWSPDGTKLTFDGGNGDWEIFRTNADGSGATNITNTPGEDRFSHWASVGSKIAFGTNRDGNNEIYSMNGDGTNPTNLTNNSASDSSATWSPDASKITFQSNRDSNPEVYIMNADGSQATNVSDDSGSDDSTSWSPDGKKVTFISNRSGNKSIYTVNSDGTGLARVTNTADDGLYYDFNAWQPLPYTETVNDDDSIITTIPASASYPTTDYTIAANETLVLDGQLCDVSVQSGGVLQGTGSACTITVEPTGTIAPGHSPGCIASGNLSLSGTYTAELAGTTPCTGYDQLQVTGTVTVGGNLNVSLLNNFTPAAGNTFTLITNDSTDPVTGTFTGLAEGTTVIIGTNRFTISYAGNDGNDVTLTALAPLPGLPVAGVEPVTTPSATSTRMLMVVI